MLKGWLISGTGCPGRAGLTIPGCVQEMTGLAFTVGICAGKSVGSTGMVLPLLSTACTESRFFLLLTPLGECMILEKKQLTPNDPNHLYGVILSNKTRGKPGWEAAAWELPGHQSAGTEKLFPFASLFSLCYFPFIKIITTNTTIAILFYFGY